MSRLTPESVASSASRLARSSRDRLPMELGGNERLAGCEPSSPPPALRTLLTAASRRFASSSPMLVAQSCRSAASRASNSARCSSSLASNSASAAARPSSTPRAKASSSFAAAVLSLLAARCLHAAPGRRRRRRNPSDSGPQERRSCASSPAHPLLQDGCRLLLVEVDHLLEPLLRRAPELARQVGDEVGLPALWRLWPRPRPDARRAWPPSAAAADSARARSPLASRIALHGRPQAEPDQQQGDGDHGHGPDQAAGMIAAAAP